MIDTHCETFKTQISSYFISNTVHKLRLKDINAEQNYEHEIQI